MPQLLFPLLIPAQLSFPLMDPVEILQVLLLLQQMSQQADTMIKMEVPWGTPRILTLQGSSQTNMCQ